MKKEILTIVFVLSFIGVHAQQIDSVALGAGYANESYYSFQNGEVANVDNGNWDLAFDLSSFGAAVRFNRRVSTLYLYPGDTSNWTSVDTTGHTTWDQFIDGYDDWSMGALNSPADAANPADLGWGIYNTLNHNTVGDRIFVVKLADGSFRKLWIQLLASGTYTFRYAMLDNSNDITEMIIKSTYSGRNFIHYSLLNETVVDREPQSTEWDIVFTNYVLELAPGYFSGVTGALSNGNVEVLEVSGIPSNDADFNGAYSLLTDEIGYDWKSFNMGTFSYEVTDSLIYFVLTNAGDIWKLVFTGFNGSSDGKIYFTKQLMTSASAEESNHSSFELYPNPADQQLTLLCSFNIKEIAVFNANGQIVRNISAENETQSVLLDLSTFKNGVYFLQLMDENGAVGTKKLIVSH